MPSGSHPEIDESNPLNDDTTQLYIGILQWAVELGCIALEKSAGTMARFSVMPRGTHMAMVLKIFAYCKKHITPKIVFDHYKKDFDNI